jgi:tetratricopeptide (TPR) repeat protein
MNPYVSLSRSFSSCYTAAEQDRKYAGESDLRKAIKTYEEALTIHTKKDHPTEHAEAQNNLGIAYGELFEIRGRVEYLEKAINAFEEASTVFTKKDFPTDYAITQNNLGIAHGVLMEVTGRKAELKKAIKAFEEALTVFTKKAWPVRHTQVKQRLRFTRKSLST